MTLKEKIYADIMSAMKSKDALRLSSLRLIKSDITTLETAKKSKEVTDSSIIKILKEGISQYLATAELFKSQERFLDAEYEIAKSSILSEYLPTMLSYDELKPKIAAILATNSITGSSSIGKAIGLCMAEFKDSADGAVVKSIVSEILN